MARLLKFWICRIIRFRKISKFMFKKIQTFTKKNCSKISPTEKNSVLKLHKFPGIWTFCLTFPLSRLWFWTTTASLKILLFRHSHFWARSGWITTSSRTSTPSFRCLGGAVDGWGRWAWWGTREPPAIWMEGRITSTCSTVSLSSPGWKSWNIWMIVRVCQRSHSCVIFYTLTQ